MAECNHNSQVYLEEVIARKNEALSNKETLTDVQKELSSIKMDVAVIRQSQLDYIRTQDQGDRQTAEELRDIKGMLMDLASDRSKHD